MPISPLSNMKDKLKIPDGLQCDGTRSAVLMLEIVEYNYHQCLEISIETFSLYVCVALYCCFSENDRQSNQRLVKLARMVPWNVVLHDCSDPHVAHWNYRG